MTASHLEFFSPEGQLDQQLKDYSFRPQQLKMAEIVMDTLQFSGTAVIEAGTGVGKTLAYLIPVIASGQKTVISTGTRHLQDQVYFIDLPLALKVTGIPRDVALLKGRSNYLCQHRLKQFGSLDLDSDSFSREYQVINEWSTVTSVGDISEVESVAEDSSIWPAVTSTRENCLGVQCPKYNSCYLLKARQRAQKADIVIVNHYLLFADLCLKDDGFGELLPNADAFVMDEAHQLIDIASQYFGYALSSRQIHELLYDVEKLMLDVGEEEVYAGLKRDLLTDLNFLQSDVQMLNQGQIGLSEVLKSEQVASSLFSLAGGLDRLEQILDKLNDTNPETMLIKARVSRIAVQVGECCEPSKQSIQWLDVYVKRLVFRSVPLNVSELYQRLIGQYSAACIYTSATLTAQDGFAHFCGQLGLSAVAECKLDSPYQYSEKALLYLPKAEIDVYANNYIEYVVDSALPLIEANCGNAFLLFTSHAALQKAARLLKKKKGLELFVQGENSKRELIKSFRYSTNGVLLGTQSFWEGVDIKGLDLSLVMIDKLPFSSPADPVVSARSRALEEQGKSAFMHYQLPQAIVSLKQGVGRLIRHETDRGVVVLFDPRVFTKRYGKLMLNQLPAMKRTQDLEQVLVFLHDLRNEHEHTMH